MKNFELDIKPAALLIFALIYFFDESGFVALVLPAAAEHPCHPAEAGGSTPSGHGGCPPWSPPFDADGPY